MKPWHRCDTCQHWRAPDRCHDLLSITVRPDDLCDGYTPHPPRVRAFRLAQEVLINAGFKERAPRKPRGGSAPGGEGERDGG